ncbi:hypothetical protein [Streptomyces virginiae]|uniref:hypothetical protein n=1 Tax=Streptomyces virginiae TaxID=1961 RepID=UPI0036EB6B90
MAGIPTDTLLARARTGRDAAGPARADLVLQSTGGHGGRLRRAVRIPMPDANTLWPAARSAAVLAWAAHRVDRRAKDLCG